jgi:hypothetical protein
MPSTACRCRSGRNIGAIDVRFEGEPFLRQAQLLAKLPHVLAQQLAQIHAPSRNLLKIIGLRTMSHIGRWPKGVDTVAAQHVAPVVLDRLIKPGHVARLRRLTRHSVVGGGSNYREDLVQSLVDLDPSIIPLQEIEPAFAGVRPVCKELVLGPMAAQKAVDNLLVSPEGHICIAECKLWQNAEAVREVVGQVLDYAAELASLSYEQLLAAVNAALRRSTGDAIADRVLGEGADEDARLEFAAAVGRSLRQGNFLLLVIGDRIRPEVERIAEMLQNHATLGLTFGLIEIAIYAADETIGPYYVQPRVLARTEIVRRTVFVSAVDRQMPTVTQVSAAQRPTTISEDEFFAELAKVDNNYPGLLRSFLDSSRGVGCQTILRRKYSVYLDDPLGGRINLGSIGRGGTIEFWGSASRDRELGQPIGRDYMAKIAALLSAAEIHDASSDPANWNIRYRGRVAVPLGDMLERADCWIEAIREVADRLRTLDVAVAPA